jgi:hypothetical protein
MLVPEPDSPDLLTFTVETSNRIGVAGRAGLAVDGVALVGGGVCAIDRAAMPTEIADAKRELAILMRD